MLFNTKTIFDQLSNDLAGVYDEKETRNVIFLLMEGLFQVSPADILVGKEFTMTKQLKTKWEESIERLKSHEPIQYVLGNAHFYGLDFKVNKDVLIPRQETEELVDWIVSQQHEGQEVLDIGTGSGCIAISIGLKLPDVQVTAWDNSPRALSLARKNAENHHINIDLQEVDVLSQEIPEAVFDLIVSNPPYIPTQQKNIMHPNVIEYEPAGALFVGDDHPLTFYSAICNMTSRILRPKGWIYFEINESFGREMVRLLKDHSFNKIELRKDINGKNRMVRGQKTES